MWDKRASETRAAHDALRAYLALGRGRSLMELRRTLGRRPNYDATLERWARDHDWKKRAEEHDRWQFETALANRPQDLEAARNTLVNNVNVACSTLVELMNDPDEKGTVRLNAAVKVLQLSGIVPPKRVELTASPGTEVEITARQAVRTMDTEKLLALRAILKSTKDG